jgi:hypothetical protein
MGSLQFPLQYQNPVESSDCNLLIGLVSAEGIEPSTY